MKFLDNVVSVFVVLIIALIIIPLPPFMLDTMFIINIIFSLVILLITMYIKNALEFFVFPSLLLVMTLLRLGLNVSSTRLILSNQGQAGHVIAAFGKFVLSGNIVIGFVVFVIIVLVNFLVITKGSERVSEVAARFKLDAMPGKQMAIDADLSSGLIDEDTARKRRSDIQRETEFYGSMDGASKFVKGDAIMSIIITLINFIGGIIVGMVQSGTSFSEVLTVYSIATVGDGLVCQVPALLVSTATGMIVTRAASDSSLSRDVTKQFATYPHVFYIAGAVLMGLCLVPGMPKPQLIVLAAAVFYLGISLKRKQDAIWAKTAQPQAEKNQVFDEAAYYKNIDNVYNLLQMDAIEMEFGYSLIPLVDEKSGSSFIDRLVTFRKQFAVEMGMVIPAVRLRDNGFLNPNQYVIKVKGEEVSRGEILVDYFLALDPGNLTGVIEGIDTIEPAYGIPSKWITPDKKEMAEIYGYTVIDALSVMVTHLSETVRKYAYELLSRQDVDQLLDTVKKYDEHLVDDVVPEIISFSNLQKILCNLLKENVPIRDMETILEVISSYPNVHDTDLLTEHIRQALKRTITRKWSDGGQIRVITLDSEVEKIIASAINKNERGTYLALDPQMTQKIITRLIENIKKVKDVMQTPIILTSPMIKRASRMKDRQPGPPRRPP